jgi:hypothetical protein
LFSCKYTSAFEKLPRRPSVVSEQSVQDVGHGRSVQYRPTACPDSIGGFTQQ